MKYVKILGLLAVAAAAMMAFAGSASAATLTSPAGTVYEGTLEAKAEGHATLDSPVGAIKCASNVDGDVEVNGKEEGGETKNASGQITSLSFTGCTEGWHVTVVSGGSLSIKSNGNGTGDVFSTGATVEATVGGIACRYATNNTTVGTATSGTPATMHISASIPFHNGSIFCGSGGTPWTGSYEITKPGTVIID